MSEGKVKAGSWPSTIRVTPTVAASPAPRGSNPLQDSFIRLEEAEQLRQQGKLDRAQKICESLVRQHPDYMGALHTLGLIHADKKNYERAHDYLARAVMLNPRSWTTLTALSGVYLRLEASEMAAQALEQARAIKPQDASVLATLGEIYREEREYELARDAYRQALALENNLPAASMGLGWVYSHLGQNAEAADLFEGVLRRGPRSLGVLHALTSLPAAHISIDVLAEMDKLDREPVENNTNFDTVAAFVRGAALDKAGRHPGAWEKIVAANRAIFPALQEDLRDSLERERTTLALLRHNRVKAAESGSREGEPISLFILGPSRSGKTTMEKLVSTLAGVKRGYENPSVDNAIRRTFQTAALLTSGYFEFLPPQLDALCRDIYLEELGRRAGSARVFTNTHPARIYDAARMVAAFPNVRFIFVKRNVEDLLLRVYMRHYNRRNAYSYDLKSARDYVLWYHQMMDLLAQKLPDIVRVIQYEDMIADPAAALRVVADLCGLPMTEAPLPAIGDDRGCAAPYRQFMAAALER